MTTYGDALRMMQVGGVDRTGFADMADALGTPGLDLIKQRRADAAEEERLAALAEALTPTQPTSTPTDDGESNNIVYEFGKGIDDYFESLLTDKGQDIYTGAKDQVRDMYGSFIEDPNPFKVDDLSVPIDADNDGTISDYEQVLSDLENDEKMMDLRNSLYYNYVEPVKDSVGNFLSTPQSQFAIDAIRLPLLMAKDKFIDPYFKSDDDPMTFKADGGRIHLQGGGMDAGKDSKSGDMGMGAGVSRDVQRSMNGGGGGGGGSNINNQSTAETVTETTEQPSMAFVKPAVTVRPEDLITIDQPMMEYSPPEETSVLDSLSNLNFFEGTYGDPDDGLSFSYDIDPLGGDASAQLGYSFADGGRVEMQLGGGIMNNLLGSQQLQNQIYQQPGFGSEISIGGPDGPITIPGPGYGPGISPPPVFPPVNIPEAQAYNPFVSTMPLYDPSTLGTGLPSTAGMVDPYFVYDRYSPAGAFDAPPANIGGFLSRKEIEKGFSDLDKFTLTKQEEKKKAAQAAAKAVKKPKDTEGKDGSKSN
tara:strand:+ start:565 stop:2160 length:1596 start_codon:yes stop_codon:yes gene_type:complete